MQILIASADHALLPSPSPQRLVAGQWLDAVEYANRIMQHALLVGVAMAAALGSCMLSGASVASLISSDVAVVAAAAPVMALLVLLLPAAAALFSLEGVLIGMNESRYLAVASLGSSLVAYVAQLLFAANGSGLMGVWSAVLIFYLLRISLLGYVCERARHSNLLLRATATEPDAAPDQ